jgi:aspartate aminotransferase-like enzyme
MGHSCRAENIRTCLRALGTILADEGLDVSAEEALSAADAHLADQPVTRD